MNSDDAKMRRNRSIFIKIGAIWVVEIILFSLMFLYKKELNIDQGMMTIIIALVALVTLPIVYWLAKDMKENP